MTRRRWPKKPRAKRPEPTCLASHPRSLLLPPAPKCEGAWLQPCRKTSQLNPGFSPYALKALASAVQPLLTLLPGKVKYPYGGLDDPVPCPIHAFLPIAARFSADRFLTNRSSLLPTPYCLFPTPCPSQLLHLSVTGPSIGCFIGPPDLSDSSRACFSAKYHFAGLSASSISISAGSNFSPSACWIMVT